MPREPGCLQASEVFGCWVNGEMLDRLTHRCHILEATGESFRLKDARRRSTGKKAAESPAKPPEKGPSASVD